MKWPQNVHQRCHQCGTLVTLEKDGLRELCAALFFIVCLIAGGLLVGGFGNFLYGLGWKILDNECPW